MTKKRLYALTGEDVSVLKDALHGPLIGMTFTGGPRVPRIAHAANALTPIDTDAAVERMARAFACLEPGRFRGWMELSADRTKHVTNIKENQS